MDQKPTALESIDSYISTFPPEVQSILEEIRAMIKSVAPQAEETISYQIPCFQLNGRYLIYFAAYKKHISLYPAPYGVPEFADALARYGAGKGTLKFPLDQPIPYDLIEKVIQYRLQENQSRTAAGKKR